LVGIQLREAGALCETLRCCVEVRLHHATGPAPGRPHVHHQRQVVAPQAAIEIRAGERMRLAVDQLRTAAGAQRVLGQTLVRDAHHGVAVAADDVHRHSLTLHRAHAPDYVADVVGDQERPTAVHYDAYRPPERFAMLVDEAGEYVLGQARRPTLAKRHEDDFITDKLA